jgi:beta-glucosidase
MNWTRRPLAGASHSRSVSRAVAATTLLLGLGCSGPDFSLEAAQKATLGQGLSADFWLGVATSSYQVEGGITNVDWADWEQGTFPDGTPHIRGGAHAGLASNSWNLWQQDHTAIQYTGANAYRLSVEWARLEPEEGVWDETAFAHYRAVFEDLRARGIEPLVTINHVTLPKWVSAKGGWEWTGIVSSLGELAQKLGERYGDLVDNWCTINEPNAIFASAYLAGWFPPGVTDMSRGLKVYATTLDAHAAIAKALRASDVISARGPGHPATFIGLAHDITLLSPASLSPADLIATSMGEDLVNESVIRGGVTGHIDMVMPGGGEIHRYNPDLKGSFDYIGLNYYRRIAVRFDDVPKIWVADFSPETGGSWAVYPQGMYEVIMRYAKYNLPILITENGSATDDENFRTTYFQTHFHAMQLAIAAGADVRGYFYWALIDNFEWKDAFQPKSGLFAVDYTDPNFKRTPRPGILDVFRQIATQLGHTPSDVLP